MRLFYLMMVFVASSQLYAQQTLNIIPAPQQQKITGGNFILSSSTQIVAAAGYGNEASWLNDYLKQYYFKNYFKSQSNLI